MTAGGANSPVFDFTSLDYQSCFDDLNVFAQTRFVQDNGQPELWTDFNDSNFGTGLLQSMAYCTDLLSYNANAQALETIISALVREQNFRNIAMSFDYQLKSASPSSGTEQINLDPAGSYPFTLSRHLQFATADGIVFQPVVDTSVPVYLSPVMVPIQQGVERLAEVVAFSTGQPGQTYALKNAFLIDGTLTVQVGLVTYTIVDNIVSVGATSLSCTISTDENGVTTLLFGDGINGSVPPKGQQITATYFTGGGAEGNLPPGTITQVIGTADGSPVPSQSCRLSILGILKMEGPSSPLRTPRITSPLASRQTSDASPPAIMLS